ncbi:hypothetical protein NGM37_30375, partial [Streptomyces sp. TRM76130]|nr:hypothetical protein [Streptomyces sp. TRM76130]
PADRLVPAAARTRLGDRAQRDQLARRLPHEGAGRARVTGHSGTSSHDRSLTRAPGAPPPAVSAPHGQPAGERGAPRRRSP